MSERYSYRHILAATTRDALNEASLGRIYQHYSNSGKKSWAILTAYRQHSTSRENQENQDRLKQVLRSRQLGFFSLMGHGQEKQPDGSITDVKEPSLFVPGIKFRDAEKIMASFNQDFILYAGPETDGDVHLIGMDGSDTSLGAFKPQKIAQYYSAVKGRPFVFEAAPFTVAETLQARGEPIPGLDRAYDQADYRLQGRTARSVLGSW